MTETPSSKSRFWLTFLVVSVIAIPLGLAILYGVGQTSGTEFSPDAFSRRSFSYNQTPYLNWVLIKKRYIDSTTPLEQNLILDGYIAPVINKTQNWHLISDSGSNAGFISAGCDARFLTSYLDLNTDEGDDYWLDWNSKFPKSAKRFWPRVADLARQEMYLKIPDVMQFAMDIEKDDDKRFSEDLDKLVAKAYFELGKLDFELKRLERAENRLRRSIELNPSPEAKKMLEKVLTDSSGLVVQDEGEE